MPREHTPHLDIGHRRPYLSFDFDDGGGDDDLFQKLSFVSVSIVMT